MPEGERWTQRERCRQKGRMIIGGAWVVVIDDKGGDCWWNCHWCQHGLDVIDVTIFAEDVDNPKWCSCLMESWHKHLWLLMIYGSIFAMEVDESAPKEKGKAKLDESTRLESDKVSSWCFNARILDVATSTLLRKCSALNVEQQIQVQKVKRVVVVVNSSSNFKRSQSLLECFRIIRSQKGRYFSHIHTCACDTWKHGM